MADPAPDQSTSDAISALSALSGKPTFPYPHHEPEEEEEEDQLAGDPPAVEQEEVRSLAGGGPEADEVDLDGWHDADTQALAQMVAHRAIHQSDNNENHQVSPVSQWSSSRPTGRPGGKAVVSSSDGPSSSTTHPSSDSLNARPSQSSRHINHAAFYDSWSQVEWMGSPPEVRARGTLTTARAGPLPDRH